MELHAKLDAINIRRVALLAQIDLFTPSENAVFAKSLEDSTKRRNSKKPPVQCKLILL